MLTIDNKMLIIHRIARYATSFMWIYQGLVPKLIYFHSDELNITQAHGIIEEHIPAVVLIAGLLEIGFGILLMIAKSATWPLYLSTLSMLVLLVDMSLFVPEFLVAAFNPVSLNLSTAALSVIAILSIDRSEP